ncbi:MAG: hypothetical protein V1776_00140 [Candidatus Diapherotrites archaeon]
MVVSPSKRKKSISPFSFRSAIEQAAWEDIHPPSLSKKKRAISPK